VTCLPLLESGLPRVAERLEKTRQIALFLDFDGTLTPIVPDPAEADLNPAVRETLQGLAGRGGVNVAVISGRALADLQRRVAVDGIVYAGNHGLEIAGRHIKFVEPVAVARRQLLLSVSKELARRLNSFPGAGVEFKELSLSVHYRQASSDYAPQIESAVRETVAATEPFLQLNPGDKVWDVLPRTGWHKGSASAWIYERLTAGSGLVIYIGDDRTDEDAFRRFRGHVTVHVGEANGTAAHYSLPAPAAVHQFLQWLRTNRRV
jgi:trehalose 6-phosphate phosphatase